MVTENNTWFINALNADKRVSDRLNKSISIIRFSWLLFQECLNGHLSDYDDNSALNKIVNLYVLPI